MLLVDTNIVVHARDGSPAVLDHVSRNVGSIALSALCLAELQRGLVRAGPSGPMRRERLPLLDWTKPAS